jgi:hypothetical protein
LKSSVLSRDWDERTLLRSSYLFISIYLFIDKSRRTLHSIKDIQTPSLCESWSACWSEQWGGGTSNND